MVKLYRATPTPEAQEGPLRYLLTFCRHHGLRVTSGEELLPDGREYYPREGHNVRSLHYAGRAVDVSVHGLDPAVIPHIIAQANRLGINVYEETTAPPCGVWTGPHLHLSISPPGTEII